MYGKGSAPTEKKVEEKKPISTQNTWKPNVPSTGLKPSPSGNNLTSKSIPTSNNSSNDEVAQLRKENERLKNQIETVKSAIKNVLSQLDSK